MIQHCINTPRHTSEPVASVQLKYSGLNPTSVERRFKASAVIFLKFILVDYKCIQRVLMLSNHKKRYLQTVFFFFFYSSDLFGRDKRLEKLMDAFINRKSSSLPICHYPSQFFYIHL